MFLVLSKCPRFINLSFMLVIFLSTALYSQLYVAVDGNDDNPGTIDQPLKTITRAIQLAAADTTIYVREGVHEYSATIRLNKSGQQGKPIKLWAYPGEKPVIDFSSQPIASSSRGLQISHNYWHVKGLEIRNAGDNGVYISAWYTVVEACRVYYCQDTGIQLSGGASYNKIINCDSFENFDSLTRGENADGFAPKLAVGPGNEFHGCRAWGNSDDGWDMWEAANTVVLNECWAFRNGYNIWGISSFEGDGNGFKLGGNYIAGPHIVTRCVAFDNKGKGFDQNNNTAGITLYNNTSWRNGTRNYSFPATPASGQHVFKNNISHAAVNQITGSSLLEANSWQGFTVTNSDFVSLDTTLAKVSRNEDSSLTRIDFLRLAETSSMIDAGVDVGFQFNGTAPDLGAFEFGPPLSINEKPMLVNTFTLNNNYPNPFNPTTTISFSLARRSFVNLKIYDALGNEVVTLLSDYVNEGLYYFEFNASGLASGVYYARATAGSDHKTIKLLLLK